MPELEQKIIDSLSYFSEITMTELMRKTKSSNRTYFNKIVSKMEKNGMVITRKVGRERPIKLSAHKEEVTEFIEKYSKRLEDYRKIINNNLKNLEKNKPLVSTEQPFKKIKRKIGVLELDEKNQVWRDMGKTQEDHAYTYKPRVKPLSNFNIIISMLNRLYQESSALSFAEFIYTDHQSIMNYQKESRVLIQDTIRKMEHMFDKDIFSKNYIIFSIQNNLFGIIYQHILKDEKSIHL